MNELGKTQKTPMTYEQLRQSPDEWRMLAMNNYGVAIAAEGGEQRLKEAIEKRFEKFQHSSVAMMIMILTDA
jgi:hypothetical protein